MIDNSETRANREFAASLGLLALVALAPLVIANEYWLGVLVVCMYFALQAAGWNLLAGYTGQMSLAPAAFAMIGAYGTGLMAYQFEMPFWVGIPVGVLAAGLLGWALGRVALKLRGPYLGLTTLSFAEIARLVIGNSYDITRGDLGLSVPGIFDSRLAYYYLFLAVLVVVQAGIFLTLKSKAGLFLQAIRDDDIAAACRGVPVVRWKVAAFVASSAICGLAGTLYAHFAQFVSPELGLIMQTGFVISMTVIGGMGTLVGPILGAFLVYLGSEAVRDFGGWHLIVFALLVIVVARFFRDGLWGLLRLAFTRRRAPAPAQPAVGAR
ncbi:MAG TPA: branched-chain amino acid ABC transporter permease [Azospirillum sp.]